MNRAYLSTLRMELSRAKDHAERLRHASRDYLAQAERSALSRGADRDADDGRVGAYPGLALWLASEGIRHVQRRPACAASYLAWSLAYLEVAHAELEGDPSLGLMTEHSKAKAWVDGLRESRAT